MPNIDERIRAALQTIALEVDKAVLKVAGARYPIALVVWGDETAHFVALEGSNDAAIVMRALRDFVDAYDRGEHRGAGVHGLQH